MPFLFQSRLEVLTGILAGFHLGLLSKWHQAKKNELQQIWPQNSMQTSETRKKNFFPLKQQSFFYRLEGLKNFFQGIKKKAKGDHWIRKSNVPGGGKTPWAFVISVTDDQASFASSPQGELWAGWIHKVHPYPLVWSSVTRKMSRELEGMLAWWGAKFNP
jgi:hypothetical protein